MKQGSRIQCCGTFFLRAFLMYSATLPCSVHASDLEREQRLSDQIVDAILDGEPLHLNANGHDFLAIDTLAQTATVKGAVIILHGRGTHPDWQQVTGPLRTGLPADGWRTLSLQMPVLAKDAKYYDYIPVFPEAMPRIDAAIRYLREQGQKRIVLIAHSCSVHMSMDWIEQRGTADLDAYITIGMGATDFRQPMKRPLPFEKIQVPLLNIYGSEDYPAVQRLAGELEQRLAGMPPPSSQVRVAGANHYFDNSAGELIAIISAWLDTLPPRDNNF